MAECRSCVALQEYIGEQDREHKEDEIDWCKEIANNGRTITEQASKITELERQLVESQRQNQQLQRDLDAMRESKQAAERVQCNADYMGSICGRG